jgi:hypothetical protein
LTAVHDDDPTGDTVPGAQFWQIDPVDGENSLAPHGTHSPSQESVTVLNESELAESS